MKKIYIALGLAMVAGCAVGQTRSEKRGVCWDNKYQKINNEAISKMAPGTTWFYTWGNTPESDATLIGAPDGMAFAPMCWNAGWNETAMSQYLEAHKGEVKYLLGYNEPNLNWTVGGSAMTPADAAANWPKVEAIAHDYGLKIVAPALQFSGDKVGDRVWQPYEWLDTFISIYKEQNGKVPEMDCLSLHCYMNWAGAMKGFATEYFYVELFEKAENQGKYNDLKAYLNDYKEENGHFPKMMLTEFCAYGENDGSGFNLTKETQIDQMTQKLQYLELSDIVEGYAWFMANPNEGYNSRPYNSIFQTNTKGSDLSDLGKVFVYMSSFDKEKWYTANEIIMAKDYVDASTDSQQVIIRPNTEEGSEIPLQCNMQKGAWTTYQIETPAGSDEMTVTVKLHLKSADDMNIWVYVNGEKPSNDRKVKLSATNGWEDRTITLKDVKEGKQTLQFYNAGSNEFLMNSISFTTTVSGISGAIEDKNGECHIYDLNGNKVLTTSDASYSVLPSGVYVMKQGNETRKVIVK